MKKCILPIIILGLSACNDSDGVSIPVYKSGMGQEQYLKSVVGYLKQQANRHTEKDRENYIEFVASLPSRLPKNINELPQNEMVNIIDNLIKETMELSEKNIGLTLNDWRFIMDPYVGKNASKASLHWVQEIFINIHRTLINAVPSSNLFATKLSQDNLYYLIKHTHYPIILKNPTFVEKYENRRTFFNEVKQLLNNNSLAYINIEEYENIQHKLAELNNNIYREQSLLNNNDYQRYLKRAKWDLTYAKQELSKNTTDKYWQNAVKERQDELNSIQDKMDTAMNNKNKLLAEYKQLNERLEQSKSMSKANIQHWKTTFKIIYTKYREKNMYPLWEDSCIGEVEFTMMYRCYSKLFGEQGLWNIKK
ncbi:hypothetical protein [Actinobacillus delphinicola]|uniref:Lipoprotein n=1 Tax=Actinobacillus delphinicola TaxID=51161 RepID=A0A448TU47_9PAST|nr:hypothetical protein [Actinobacillus delphinicola]VEJ09514.1 Uncharacterised protein [Actinobacillus delphinicola]